jgi:hypothetical protein
MQLTPHQAAAFGSVYRDYDVEQNTLIDQKLAAFQDYAQNFMGMNDEKADQLAQKIVALDYQDPERPRGLILPRGEPNPVSDGPSNRFDPADR